MAVHLHIMHGAEGKRHGKNIRTAGFFLLTTAVFC